MARSIMQRTKECYLCRKAAEAAGFYGALTDKGLHRHHVIFGKGYRNLSEQYGLWVYLCYEHHEGDGGVHKNKEINVELRQQAERAFLKEHTIDQWRRIFTRNYLDENEINRIMTEQRDKPREEKAENKPIGEAKTRKKCIMTEAPPEGFFFIE